MTDHANPYCASAHKLSGLFYTVFGSCKFLGNGRLAHSHFQCSSFRYPFSIDNAYEDNLLSLYRQYGGHTMIQKAIAMKPELWDALKKEADERGGMSVNALIRYFCLRGLLELSDD